MEYTAKQYNVNVLHYTAHLASTVVNQHILF